MKEDNSVDNSEDNRRQQNNKRRQQKTTEDNNKRQQKTAVLSLELNAILKWGEKLQCILGYDLIAAAATLIAMIATGSGNGGDGSDEISAKPA